MRRYKYIKKEEIFESWNRLRAALLAAKDGNQVNDIMFALFTEEERFQLGRRIQVAECLIQKMTIAQIKEILNVGNSTVLHISRRIEKYPTGFSLIFKRRETVEKEYQKGKTRSVGGSKRVFKEKVYTGLKRKDIQR